MAAKWYLSATVLLIGISTLFIGLLPSYPSTGITSSWLLIIFLLLQGLGSDAEQGGTSRIVAGFAPADKRDVYTALPFAGIIVGILLVVTIFSLVQYLPESAFTSWSWRLPFLASTIILIAGVVIRDKVKESPIFKKN